MTNPVPGYSVTTAYKKTGSSWTACGWHTGQDYASPTGTKIVAARAGTVKHVNYGSSFGTKQVAVQCDDGTEDFYAHMSYRVANGTKVAIGAKVGEVGNEGNSTGPHLHFERHKAQNSWTCSNMDDPMKSHNYEEDDEMAWSKEDQERFFNSDSVNSPNPDNPTWAFATYLEKIYDLLIEIRDKK